MEHEYGHYLQSKASGALYLLKYGLSSAINNDNSTWYELDADARGNAYNTGKYNSKDFRENNPKWWEYMVAPSPYWWLIPNRSLNLAQ